MTRGMKRIFLFCTAICFMLNAGCSREDEPEPEEPGSIIVLMYHRIVKGEASNLYERSLEDLEADLKYLNENNVKVISFSDLEALSASGTMPEGNSVIITFDDGDSSWYTLVRPLLLKYQMKATFFLWTYMMGRDSFLTWEEVEDMSHYMSKGGEKPFTFGSHTYSHTYLLMNKSGFATAAEYNSFLDYEFSRSKDIIEEHIPGLVTILSLPYGDGAGDPEIISAAERNGYKFIRTSTWGAIENPNQDLFVIPSLPMLDSTEPELIGQYLGF
jgi:peptidoglycan/xylan/chitin deacetylase (PgdA/CDA1 family)